MSGQAYENNGPFTMTSGEALVADRLVLISSSTAMYADGGEEPIGLTGDAVATSTPVTIKPLQGGIMKVTGSKALTAGVAIYCTTDGKVSDAIVGKQIGVMMTAITGDGGKGSAIMWGTHAANDIFSSIHGSTIDFFEDFFTFNDDDNWVDTVSDAGTVDSIDASGGVLSIATGATDNNESYVSSEHETFLFQTDKKLILEARVKLTEANTDDANIIVGLSDTVAADSLIDDGAGPMASYDGAVFFKVDGGTVWQAETSNATTQKTDTDAGAFSDDTWTILQIIYDYNDGVTANVTFYVDGTLGATLTLTIAGLQEMHLLLGAKAGDANAETLLVDYVHVIQER